MAKIDFDINITKRSDGPIPGPRKRKYYAHLQEAIDAAKKKIEATGEVYVIYYSGKRHITCRYRIADHWRGKWRGEQAVWISGNAIPGNV